MLPRPKLTQQLETALTRSHIVILIGPRQCGKTTLARTFVPPDSLNYFDLEDPISLARLKNPMTALRDLQGVIVIDELQRHLDLFPVLRTLVDRNQLAARFLILGSMPPKRLRQSVETLAGRFELITMSGFALAEVGMAADSQHWLWGGFPLSFLAQSDEDSMAWRKNFIQTFLERDLPQFGIKIPAQLMLRFWTMLVPYHGRVWNAADLARSLGVSQPTAHRYMNTLTDLFMIRQLPPWYANLSKRQVKSPKIYFRDTGLLHQLSGIRSWRELMLHSKSGASWEGYAIEETIKAIKPDEAYFWGIRGGAELDLLLLKDGRRLGIQYKWVDVPHLMRTMQSVVAGLELDSLTVVYPGERPYPLTAHITAKPLTAIISGQL